MNCQYMYVQDLVHVKLQSKEGDNVCSKTEGGEMLF